MNKKMNDFCELCSFNNPKGTVTGVIIRDNKILLLKRNEEPYKGLWDLPGGYMGPKELPEEAMKRELEEELGINARLTFIKTEFGTSYWKDSNFPIISHFFLVEYEGEIKLDEKENSEIKWVSINSLEPREIAFDSNEKMADFVKENFYFDIERGKELVSQLDPSAEVKEQNIYKAILNGYVSCQYNEEGKLIGFGWIFPRQTLLRNQAVVEDMIVDEKYRGQGLGKEILLDLLGWAWKNGVEVVELTTNPKREAANALYQKVGFKLHPTNHYLYKVEDHGEK